MSVAAPAVGGSNCFYPSRHLKCNCSPVFVSGPVQELSMNPTKGLIRRTMAVIVLMVTALPQPASTVELTSTEIDRLIQQLGSSQFSEREAASQRLDTVGETALGQLRRAVTNSPDAEVRHRAGRLIRAIEQRLYGDARIFTGHTRPIVSVAFAPDGKRILTGAEDNTVKLWDLATGKVLLTLTGHTGGVWAVAFAPDGKRALSGSNDNSMRYWDLDTGKELHCFKEHTSSVRTVAFAPDGRRAVSGCYDHKVRLWDLTTFKEVRVLAGHADMVMSVAYSSDGKRILSGGARAT